YSGDIVDVTFASGRHLSATPNHPVLTTHGWVAAGLLDESSNVVRSIDAGRLARIVNPDDHQIPAVIEQVAGATGSDLGVLPVAVPLAAEDFHGDGVGSEVAVVRADGLLRDALDATLGEQVGQDLLVAGIESGAILSGDGGGAEGFDGSGGPAHCCMCGGDIE